LGYWNRTFTEVVVADCVERNTYKQSIQRPERIWVIYSLDNECLVPCAQHTFYSRSYIVRRVQNIIIVITCDFLFAIKSSSDFLQGSNIYNLRENNTQIHGPPDWL
jgi:hypothetical protein